MAVLFSRTYRSAWASVKNLSVLHLRVPHIGQVEYILLWLAPQLCCLELGSFEYGMRGDTEISDVAALIRNVLLRASVKMLGLYSCRSPAVCSCLQMPGIVHLQQRQDAFNSVRCECAIRQIEFKDDADDFYAPS